MIDDLFDSKVKVNESPEIGFDHVLTEVFPKDLKEYAKIIFENTNVGVFSEFSDSLANLLPSDPKELRNIDVKKAVFSKEQVSNLTSSLNQEIIFNDNFKEMFISKTGIIYPIDYEKFSSISAIANAGLLYNTLVNAIKQDLINPPAEYNTIIMQNKRDVERLLVNSLIIRDFLSENIDTISRNLQ